MCGMKTDCGGAAGMLGSFYLAVKMVTYFIVVAYIYFLSYRLVCVV